MWPGLMTKKSLASNMDSDYCVEYIWELENFNSSNVFKISSNFTANNGTNSFYLYLYDKRSLNVLKDYTVIQLGNNNYHTSFQVQCRISLLNQNNEKCLTDESVTIFDGTTYGPAKGGFYLIKHSYVLNSANNLLTDGKLRIYCAVKVLDNESFPNFITKNEIQNENLKALQDYELLLESCKHSDVVCVVGEKEFKLHKVILSARSPVFAAMFDSELEENKQNRVEIPDVEVEVFEELVCFIYTGKIPKMDQYAWELFVVSDKYQLDSLKDLCEKSLSASLTIESVTKVLTLADMHNATKLKSNCVDYVTEHSSEVMATEGWKQMVKQRVELVIELYQRLTVKYEKK